MGDFYRRQEIFINSQLACDMCLSRGRKLQPLGCYSEIYHKLTSGIQNKSTMASEQLLLCWECRAQLQKAEQFVQKVENKFRTQNRLQSLQDKSNVQNTLSTLTTVILNDINYTYLYINSERNILTEDTLKILKDEENIENYEQSLDKDEIRQDSNDIEANIKTELNLENEQTESKKSYKSVNKWARKRAILNKKPKFRILTNNDVNNIFRIYKINSIELDKYLESKKNRDTYKSSNYRCLSCAIGFKEKSSLTLHNKKRHDKNIGLYSCDICDCIFKDKRHLAAHVSKHYDKYVCVVCSYCTYNAKERDRHAKGHKTVYRCVKCELMFGNRREFFKHYKERHEKFICDYCGISFKMRYCIKDHIRKQHSPFECVPCSKRFARYSGLWLHNKTQHTAHAHPAYCVECDKLYPDVYRYRWHLANSARHKPRKKARIPCPSCDKVFTKKIYMKDHHNLVHLKQYKYRCEDCDKNFIRNADLVKHTRRVHEGILPPKNKICYMCGRGFTTNKILANHIRTHTGERPFACALCPAAFAQAAARDSHARALHHTR